MVDKMRINFDFQIIYFFKKKSNGWLTDKD